MYSFLRNFFVYSFRQFIASSTELLIGLYVMYLQVLIADLIWRSYPALSYVLPRDFTGVGAAPFIGAACSCCRPLPVKSDGQQ